MTLHSFWDEITKYFLEDFLFFSACKPICWNTGKEKVEFSQILPVYPQALDQTHWRATFFHSNPCADTTTTRELTLCTWPQKS